MKHVDKPLESNVSGYNLICLSEDQWAFEVVDAGIHRGSFLEVVKFAIRSYAFSIREIEVAIEEMNKRLVDGHNAAHFGMWGSFIFTFKKETNERKAS